MLYRTAVARPTDLPTSDLSLEAPESKVDFRAYWRTIRKRWPFVVLSMIVATVIAFVYTYRQPKIYEATCQVIIEPMAPQVLPGSKDVVELGTGTLLGEQGILRDPVPHHPVDQRRAADRREAGAAVRSGLRGRRWARTTTCRARPRGRRRRSAVKPLKDSRLALITVTDRKPQRAALIANTIADTYIEYNLDYKLEGARSAMAWLAEQEVGSEARSSRSRS